MNKVNAFKNTESLAWVNLHYVDLVGVLHELTVSKEEYENSEFFGIDGSSVNVSEVNESDLTIVPDKTTFKVLPWNPAFGRVFCNVRDNSRSFWGDTRGLPFKLMEYLRDYGVEEVVGVELEFFIMKVKARVSPTASYVRVNLSERPPKGHLKVKNAYQICGDRLLSKLVRHIVTYSRYLGIPISKVHHEVAPNQFELVIPSSNVLSVSDAVIDVKYVSRYVTSKTGFIANFMPKPLPDDNGSGMHVHVSLKKDGINLFYDPEDPFKISQYCRYFIGGLLQHGRSLSALVSPTINSYKRLTPGYEAPIYLAWGFSNRSAAVRVPKALKPGEVRVEYRPPDPSSNPYVALTAVILAGLDGIKRKIDPGDPVRDNLYKLDERKAKEMGFEVLPRSLEEALDELENDNAYLKQVFTNEFIGKYIDVKKREIREVTKYPTPSEYINYLSV